MKVKLTFLEAFDSEFNGTTYKILQFCNPITFEVVNGVNLNLSVKLVPYELYLCTMERRGKKWKVTDVAKLD